MQSDTPSTAAPSPDSADARQVRYWNSPATAPWVTWQERLDEMFAPLTNAAMDLAKPAPGEQVLDVGCGCGATVLELARRVGIAGRVRGIDISAPMLARAENRVTAAEITGVTLTLADAATYAFEPASLDLVFSRVGVMFFGDPIGAFGNLRRALKPSGRMVFLCCRSAAENRYITTAVQAAQPLLPPGATPIPGPEEPGMFSLADPARVRRILGAAGFRDVDLQPLDQRMRLAGPGGAADGAAFSLQFGPLTRVLGEAGPALQQSILDAVTETYRRLEQPEGIMLDGAFWIVTAHP
jgi:SAM-dependent methyltransferase